MENQNMIFFPEGLHHKLGQTHSGVGLSVGKNSIGVYEHSANFISCVLSADVNVPENSRIAVVYKDNVPSVYLNGKLVKRGEKSKRTAHLPVANPSNFDGKLSNVRLESRAFDDSELLADMSFKSNGDGYVAKPLLRLKAGKLYGTFFKNGNVSATLSDGREVRLTAADVPSPIEITPPMLVKFDKSLGAPESAVFDKLESWTLNKNVGIANYSGMATYIKKISIPDGVLKKGTRVYIEADNIAEVAQVLLNGKSAGGIWKSPYILDITRLIKSGENLLEIKVANTWVNRCLYDSSLPASERITWSNSMAEHFPSKDDRPNSSAWSQGPIESGIIGGLRIKFSKEVSE